MAAVKAAKKVTTTEEKIEEVQQLEKEVQQLEAATEKPKKAKKTTKKVEEVAVVETEKKGFFAKAKDKTHEFGENHPKLTKAAKAVGVATVGVVGGVIGYALGKDSVDIDLVDRLFNKDDDDVETTEF